MKRNDSSIEYRLSVLAQRAAREAALNAFDFIDYDQVPSRFKNNASDYRYAYNEQVADNKAIFEKLC